MRNHTQCLVNFIQHFTPNSAFVAAVYYVAVWWVPSRLSFTAYVVTRMAMHAMESVMGMNGAMWLSDVLTTRLQREPALESINIP